MGLLAVVNVCALQVMARSSPLFANDILLDSGDSECPTITHVTTTFDTIWKISVRR